MLPSAEHKIIEPEIANLSSLSRRVFQEALAVSIAFSHMEFHREVHAHPALVVDGESQGLVRCSTRLPIRLVLEQNPILGTVSEFVGVDGQLLQPVTFSDTVVSFGHNFIPEKVNKGHVSHHSLYSRNPIEIYAVFEVVVEITPGGGSFTFHNITNPNFVPFSAPAAYRLQGGTSLIGTSDIFISPCTTRTAALRGPNLAVDKEFLVTPSGSMLFAYCRLNPTMRTTLFIP